MGCDGGTIPKRNEIVKNKQKHQGRDKNADLSAKWQFCSISGLRLKKPIVACQLGRLYNKDAIIEYLLELKTSGSTSAPTSSSSSPSQSMASHIKSLKDVKELKLKEKPDFNRAHQASSGSEQFKAQFVCPISGLDINGKYKFHYILTCGCVISERALKEVPSDKQCILCSKPYDSDMDLIVLNGDETETKELKDRLFTRRRRQRSLRKVPAIVADDSDDVSCQATSSLLSVKVAKHTNDHEVDQLKPSKRHKLEATAVR